MKNYEARRCERMTVIVVIIKSLIASWALAGNSLSPMLTGYTMDVKFFKNVFTVLEFLDGWGPECLFMTLGLGTIFYLVRNRQKVSWVSWFSFFCSICTVIGISYSKTNSWDCIFLFGSQFLLAAFVTIGYYLIYKNCILIIFLFFERKNEWLSDKANGKFSIFLFEKHSFIGPFFFAITAGLPWLIAFFPGTLQWDAHKQLWMALGVEEQTSYHPVFITNLNSRPDYIEEAVGGFIPMAA